MFVFRETSNLENMEFNMISQIIKKKNHDLKMKHVRKLVFQPIDLRIIAKKV